MAVSPDRTHMALSHSGYGEEWPVISIYKIYNAFQNKEKQQTFRFPIPYQRYNDSQTDKIIIMAFSNNARFLACMTE
jgi:hypothetical protein